MKEKARKVQNFTRGGDPYVKLGIGSRHIINEFFRWVLETQQIPVQDTNAGSIMIFHQEDYLEESELPEKYWGINDVHAAHYSDEHFDQYEEYGTLVIDYDGEYVVVATDKWDNEWDETYG